MNILFVCRGNASRSLMAETYLRSLEIPNVTTGSAGTVAEANKSNNAQFYKLTAELLDSHKLCPYMKDGYGAQLTQDRVDKSDLVVFLNKIVYEEAQAIVNLPANTVTWKIIDTGEKGREYTMPEERQVIAEEMFTDIKQQVTRLIKNLS